ncbi:MAG: ABC transporter substrate-binding protein [Eubacterium sp.]|nr:ABC transporter substrate-binding protein [Eubacterium sp.]
MIHSIKRKWIYILAFCGVLLLSACGKEKKTENDPGYKKQPSKVVGFSQLGAESDWRVANTESVKNTFTREKGYELLFDDGQQKQDKQIMAMRKFIQQEVDYIILAPVTETGWDTVLMEAHDAGVPVIVVDRKVDIKDEDDYLAWVGSDFGREGQAACEWLKSFADAKGIKAEDIHIADIQGTIGATAQIGRTQSLAMACRENGWNLVASEPADYTEAKGYEVVSRLLREHEEINVLYCENDNEALGAIIAVEEQGRKVGTDIKNGEIMIISFDAARAGLRKVLEGKIALDVECNPLQGPEIERIINDYAAGKEIEKYTYVSEQIFSADNTVKEIKIGNDSCSITLVTEELLNGREY